MGVEIRKTAVVGGTAADHTHTANGDGGDTIDARFVTAHNALRAGDLTGNPGTLRLNDGATYYNTITSALDLSANRTLSLPNVNGRIFVVGTGANPATLVGTLSIVNMVGQTGNIASTVMGKTVPAGMYMVNLYMECSTAGAANSNVVLTITYTDSVGGKTSNITLASDATSNKAQTTIPIYLNVAGDITWAAVRTGGTYTVRIRTSFMGG